MIGAADSRTLADFGRSGAVEAIAGGAKAEELAHAMGVNRHWNGTPDRRPKGTPLIDVFCW
jgi:hypothetical protein